MRGVLLQGLGRYTECGQLREKTAEKAFGIPTQPTMGQHPAHDHFLRKAKRRACSAGTSAISSAR